MIHQIVWKEASVTKQNLKTVIATERLVDHCKIMNLDTLVFLSFGISDTFSHIQLMICKELRALTFS